MVIEVEGLKLGPDFYLFKMRPDIKNRALRFLNESEGHIHMDSSVIGTVRDVRIDPNEDYIRIDFQTTYGQEASILTKYGQFKKWFSKHKDEFANVFRAYVAAYLDASKEQPEAMEEIVDGDGNLYGDSDLPSNGTGKMVGQSVWDLEKVYASGNVRGNKKYTGDLGIGIITW